MSAEKAAKKVEYFARLNHLIDTYNQILIVEADFVGSKQMAEVRLSLRGKAVILMGKNTMIRTALRQRVESQPELEALIPLVKSNIGLVFCIAPLAQVRKLILTNRVPAPAKQGVIAPDNVTIPAGNTSLDPSQTSFFQVLGISTKIVKSAIEIQNDVDLIKVGDKMTASQCVLLQKLGIRPFTYGLGVTTVYDKGSVYAAKVLDMTDEAVRESFMVGVKNVAALCRQIGLPSVCSVPHSLVEAFRMCVSVALGTGFDFAEADHLKKTLNV